MSTAVQCEPCAGARVIERDSLPLRGEVAASDQQEVRLVHIVSAHVFREVQPRAEVPDHVHRERFLGTRIPDLGALVDEEGCALSVAALERQRCADGGGRPDYTHAGQLNNRLRCDKKTDA